MPEILPTLTADSFPAAVLRAERPLLVLFGADYCPACRLMEAILAEFAERHPEVQIAYVDVLAPDALALRERHLWPLGASFSVSLLPTTVLFARGRPQLTLYGALPNVALEERLAPWLQTSPQLRDSSLTPHERRALAELWTKVLPGRRLRPSAREELL